MYSNEKRHACGSLKPNLYFLLQIISILLLLLLVLQLVELFNLGVHIILISSFIAIALIMYFLIRRKKVLQRQKWFCSHE